jgi:predicted nucleotidyltransferase
MGNMDSSEIKHILAAHAAYLKETYYVKELGVFGSFSTGKQKKTSDVDVLVAFTKGHKDYFNYVRLKCYLEELIGRKVDLVPKEAVKPRLKDKIFSEVEYVK